MTAAELTLRQKIRLVTDARTNWLGFAGPQGSQQMVFVLAWSCLAKSRMAMTRWLRLITGLPVNHAVLRRSFEKVCELLDGSGLNTDKRMKKTGKFDSG